MSRSGCWGRNYSKETPGHDLRTPNLHPFLRSSRLPLGGRSHPRAKGSGPVSPSCACASDLADAHSEVSQAAGCFHSSSALFRTASWVFGGQVILPFG